MFRLAILLGVLTLLSTPAALRAQSYSSEGARAWVSVGLGSGSFRGGDDATPLALLAALVVRQHRHRFSLRGSVVEEVLGDGVGDVGVLYGRAWTGERSEHSVSAGIAVVYGEDCHGLFGGPCDPSATVGLPLSATLSFRPSTFLGVGLEVFANLNRLASFVGLSAMLELGAVR